MPGTPDGEPAPYRRTVAVALLPALVVAVFVAAHISSTIPFDSDEANHANLGLRQFQDLRDGAWLDFIRHSYRTGQFPFLHGWTLLPWFGLLGPTVFAARVAQCAAFVFGAACTGWAAFRVSGDDRRTGVLAAWLFGLSPALAGYSALCMLETPGAAATALTLAVFAEASRAQGGRATVLHAATAGAVLVTYFTKLNYGLWIAPAILAGIAVRLSDGRTRRAAIRHAAVYLGVLAVAMAVWYATNAQRQAFLGFLHNPAQEVPVEMDDPGFSIPGIHVSNVLGYLRTVPADFHVHWTLGGLVVTAFLAGLRLWRRPVVAAAAACVAWTGLILCMGFREYALTRFVATALPALWVVAAVSWTAWDGPRWTRPGPVVTAGLVTVAGAVLFAVLPGRIVREYEVGDEFRQVFEFVEKSVEGPASVLVVNYTDHTSVRTMTWQLWQSGSYRDFDLKGLIAERRFESADRFRAWMTDSRPWGDSSWTSYVVEIRPGPEYLDWPVVVPETLALWRRTVASYGTRLEVVTTTDFAGSDLGITIFRDRRPPPHLGLGGR